MGVTATQPKQVGPGRWEFTINLPPSPTVRYPRKQVTCNFVDERGRPVSPAKGRKLADDERRKVLNDIEERRCTDPSRLTFAMLAERWLEAEEAETDNALQPVTIDFYRINLQRHILPTLGYRIAAEILPADLSALYNAKQGTLAKGSIKHVKATISAAYAWGVESGLQDRNPAISTRRRRYRDRRRQPDAPTLQTWDHAEIATAVHLARGRLAYLPLMFGAWCGLRRGEVCGLRWDDVDLEAGTVTITRSLEQVGSNLHVCPPKSDAGYRTVPMPKALCDALEEQHRVFAGLRLRHEGRWNPDGYVLATGRGTPVKPRNLSSSWSDFCRAKGLRHIRFHDLRHSFATDLLLRQHEDVNVVAELLGHSDPATTLRIYAHPDEKMHKRAGMRQNRRVAAAMEKVSRLSRDQVKPLREAAG